MKIKFISDSTFLMEHNGCRILTDPWIGSNIYGGAWMQFPPPICKSEDIGPLDYIFISHIHEDHCDPKTIAKLDRNAKVLIMGERPDFISMFLKKHGFSFKEIIRIPSFKPVEIYPGLSVEMIDADPSHQLSHMIDSSMVLHTGKKSVFFANDNSPYDDASRYLSKYDFSLALLPAAGGSGYPACYDNLTEVEQKNERDRIRQTYYSEFSSTVRTISPDRFMAVAGYHVISGRNYAINEYMSFLSDPAEAYSVVYENLSDSERNQCAPVQLEPGDEYDTSLPGEDTRLLWSRAVKSNSWQERKSEFLKSVASKTAYDHDSLTLPDDFNWEALFSVAAENLLKMIKVNDIDFSSNIYVPLPKKDKTVVGCINGSLAKYSVISENDERISPYLEVKPDANMLYQLLTGEFSWNIADAACFIRYKRAPNIFDQPAFIALNYLRAPSAKDQKHAELY